MKLAMAIIEPFKLNEVRQALAELGQGMAVTEVRGCGRQKGHTEIYRGAEYTANFIRKLEIEVGVSANQVDKRAADAIDVAAKIGDSKIFVRPIEQAARTRTNESASYLRAVNPFYPRVGQRMRRRVICPFFVHDSPLLTQ